MGARHPTARAITRMAAQEERHRARLDALMTERRVRPTLLEPFWSVAGFALGAATALIGPEAAMACTAAVETEIDLHYGAQLERLGDEDPELSAIVAEFQAEEIEHRETALAAGAERAPGYPLLSAAIRMGCRAAIRLSERI
jgi:ubiquinone biosynthesis monooxygenase Coq7